MPTSAKQRRTAGMDLARKRAGKEPKVMKGATEAQLKDLASGPVKKGASRGKR